MATTKQLNHSVLHDIIAGVTVFVTISYILVANPLILSRAGMDPGAVFAGTCIAAGVASIISGFFSRTPAALAPGMAFNVFFLSFVTTTHMPWQSALFLCLCAGVIVFLLSVFQGRFAIIESIPAPLRVAVTGGIGAILAENGIDLLRVDPSNKGSQFAEPKVMAFLAGVLVIVVFYISLRQWAVDLRKDKPAVDGQPARKGRPNAAAALDLIGRSSFLISIVVTTLVALANHSALSYMPTHLAWAWSGSPSMLDILHAARTPAAVSFVVFLVYMLLVDIVGSPYDLVPRTPPAEHARKAKRGFLVDSTANLFAPALGTTPVIYYAENHTARVIGAKGGLAAITVGALFLGVLAVVYSVQRAGSALPSLPEVAVAPALFAVGLIVISNAIGEPHRIERANESLGEEEALEDVVGIADRLPAGLTIVLTPLAGLENGLAAGLLAYYVQFVFVPKDQRDKEFAARWPLHFLTGIAAIALLVRMVT